MTKRLLLGVALLFTIFVQGQVVINELDADTPGLDVQEFIELKSETPYFSLDGYILVFYNGGTSGTGILSYFTINLNGLVTDGNGIVVIGNSQLTPYPSMIIPQNSIQNGPDAVGLYLDVVENFPIDTPATATNLIDALVYGNSATQATALKTILGVSTQINENANSLAASQSIQRKNDGTYEVKTPTPRRNNDGSGIIYNGIAVSSSAMTINEGQSITLTFQTDTPVTESLQFNLSLTNGSFTTADFTGNTTLTIPAGGSTTSTVIQLVDDGINDGDETMSVLVTSLPEGFIALQNLKIRVRDMNFVVASWGTPMSPTYGNVTTTAPSDYYASCYGLSGNALKQALQDIIANPEIVRAHSYGDVVEILNNADQNPANNNEVWLMYVEQPKSKLDYQTGASILGVWNREHIWPQSRGGFANGTSSFADGINIWLPTNADDILAGHSDAHHIRAEDGQENSSRSNRDYGSDYNGPANTSGTWRGDVARALFYMAVRYNGLSLVNGNPPDNTMFQMGDLASLLNWNTTDPSDDFEMNRNNYIYTWQMNRNPFIDHPELANYIFGANFGEQWFPTLSNPKFNVNDVKVYPIPAQNEINISGIESRAEVEIFSITGTKVFSTTIDGFSTLQFNLASGMYMLKWTTAEQQGTHKIIIK
ncbi:endonuclease [Flavobacterium sp.]|uniref:endonuclease I family protein n=1 Tax=Flavobacterium sp. TaxID=239 RepID=UPI0039E46794